MPGLVICDALTVLDAEEDLPLGAEQSPLDRFGEVCHRDRGLALARRAERRLVDEVAQVGAHETWRLGGDLVDVDVRRQRHVARVDLQDRGAAATVG